MLSGKLRVCLAGLSTLVAAFTFPALAQQPPAPAPAAPALPRIDVELFERGQVDRSKGCSFALWQDNRDPEKDRFAYLFIENLGRGDVRENARIRVGGEVITFKRVAVGGGQEFGNKTFPYALYKADKDASWLIFNLTLDSGPGEVLEVKSGSVTIIRPGRMPFIANVKGDIACNMPPPRASAPPPAAQASAPAPAPAPTAPAARTAPRPEPLEAPAMFERYAPRATDIPANMRAEAVKFGCDAAMLRQGAIGYSLSEESALWELNCTKYAGNIGSKIFALVYTIDPKAQYTFHKFAVPKGKNHQGSPQELLGVQWDMAKRIVTSTHTEGNGSDCGTYQRHQLVAEGNFVLIEYREKPTCDGKSMKPSEFPLVYRR